MILSNKSELSKRELEIARLKCRGLTRKEIANKLFIDSGTVRNHNSSIYRKTHTTNEILFMHWYYENLIGINLLKMLD